MARVPLFSTVLVFSLFLLVTTSCFTLGDHDRDRYDYDQCARRCWDKPAHERQICVAACSSRHSRPDERRAPIDPRREEVDRCLRRCEKQDYETEARCLKRCEELFGSDTSIYPRRDLQEQDEDAIGAMLQNGGT